MKNKEFKEKIIVITDNIRSAFNVGSIFRTADAAGVDKIYLCGITPTPIPERGVDRVSKISLGAEKNIEWEKCNNTWRLIEKLKTEDFNIIGLELSNDAIDYKKFKPKFPTVLIIGNEVRGLSKNILSRVDTTIKLPMYGDKESLNVSVAFGIAVYKLNEFRK